MKKFLLFAVSVLCFVVGLQGSQQIQVPDSLPIGAGFTEATNIEIAISIGSNDDWRANRSTNFMYVGTNGSLEDQMVKGLAELAKNFVPTSGMEGFDYWIGMDASFVVQTHEPTADWNGKEYWNIAGNYPGYNPERFFKLENGKVPSRVLDVTIGVNLGGVPVYAKGLTEVILVRADEFGNEYSSETSPNGISDKTCSEYPGGSAYIPDALMVPALVMYPPFWDTYREFFGATVEFEKPRGYYYLTFGAAKATWAKYDLETGMKLDSNEQLPIRLEISWVDLASIKLTSLSSRKTSATGMGLKLRVTGTYGKTVAIEYSDVVKGGTWTELTTAPLTYGWAEYVDEPTPGSSARFYRVRQK